jgi:hypothetical protein
MAIALPKRMHGMVTDVKDWSNVILQSLACCHRGALEPPSRLTLTCSICAAHVSSVGCLLKRARSVRTTRLRCIFAITTDIKRALS